MSLKSYSTARYEIISKFYPSELLFSTKELSEGSPDEPFYSIRENTDGYLPNLPVIIKGNGEPWKEANLYIVDEALRCSSGSYNDETFKTKALGILAFLRWCEEEGVDPLWIPKQVRRQPLRRFAEHLEFLAVDPRVLIADRPKSSTLKSRFNAVRTFFEGLERLGVIPAGSIQIVQSPKFKQSKFTSLTGEPSDSGVLFSKETKTITKVGASGRAFKKTISVADLTLNVPKNQKGIDLEEGILDGGTRLFPLIPQQEYLLRKALSEQPNRGYELMCRIALDTGARLQTVCTLRIHQLYNLTYDRQGYAHIGYGGKGYIADGKYGKSGTLFMTKNLVNNLLTYANSDLMINRRKKSRAGYVDEDGEIITNNYLFLDRSGSPYYLSVADDNDQRNEFVDRRTDRVSASAVKNKKGRDVEQFIRELRKKLVVLWARYMAECKNQDLIRELENLPEFSFHDLRATFCMNALRNHYKAVEIFNEKHNSDKKLVNYDWALNEVRKLMNHEDESITRRYIKYDLNPLRKKALRNAFENELLGNYEGGDLDLEARESALKIEQMLPKKREKKDRNILQYEHRMKSYLNKQGRKI